LEKKERT